MEIRRASAEDVGALSGIVQRAYEPYLERIGRRPRPMDDDLRPRVDAGQVWLAAIDGIRVGLIVTVAHPDHLLIENVAVEPTRHGRGIGKALLAEAEAIADRAGLGELRLYTNAAMTENRAIYAHLGYRQADQRDEAGFDRVFFVKKTT